MSTTALVPQDEREIQPLPDLRVTLMQQIADPSTPMEIREKALAMIERVQDRWARQRFNAAVREVQPLLPHITKRGLIQYGPGKGSTPYAKWDDIHKACMPVLSDHGFSCSFSSELQGTNALKVTMTVKHVDGGEDTGSIVVPWLDTGGSKSPAQQAASSETLAQRHAFVKYWNVLTEDKDDDGTGKGVSEKITEAQALQISDILQECDNREPGMSGRFHKWMKAEMRAEKVSDLFQGDQLESVKKFLKAKMQKLGIA